MSPAPIRREGGHLVADWSSCGRLSGPPSRFKWAKKRRAICNRRSGHAGPHRESDRSARVLAEWVDPS